MSHTTKINPKELKDKLELIKSKFRKELNDLIEPYKKDKSVFLLTTELDFNGNPIDLIDQIGLAINQEFIKENNP